MPRRASRRSSVRRLTTAALALLVACGGPTDPPKQEMAQLAVSASVAGTAVATIVVRVSAADINPPLLFNIPVVNDQAAESIVIPAGSNRRLQLEAYDANSIKTHEGETTIAVVRPGTANNAVTIALNPIPGNQPITATFGKLMVTLSGTTTVAVGRTTQLTATIQDGAGRTLNVPAGEIKWATDNPAVATVNATGLVTGVGAGTATVMATHGGAGGAATITVTPPSSP